jgi:hypothetical protein
MLEWDRYGLHKKHARTRYAKLVFLHLVGSVGQVEHSVRPACETSMHYFSCSGGPNAVSIKSVPGHVMSNLCFCILWDLQHM